MDPIVTLLIVVISIITTMLVVVGVHIIQVLRELRTTIQKTSNTIDTVHQIAGHIHSPLGKGGGIIEGLKTGLNLAQAFAVWLSQNHHSQEQHEQ